jgi:hypothetical protein
MAARRQLAGTLGRKVQNAAELCGVGADTEEAVATFLVLLQVPFVAIPIVPAMAQQDDVNSLLSRFNDYLDAMQGRINGFVLRKIGREPCNEYACSSSSQREGYYPRKLLLTSMGFNRMRSNGRRASAPAGSQVIRIPGLQARPLGDGTSIGTEILLA